MTADDAAAPAPFWNVNVPAHLRTAECPDFLLGAGDKDRGILATPDARYRARAWAEVCAIVRANRLERFQRRPSDLRRYRAFVYFLVREYGGVADFVLRERLRWEAPVRPRGAQFQYPEDYKILFNDWPYGIDPRIVHLVIWTKFPLEEDSTTHDLTDRARKAIETFVSKTFYSSIARDHVSTMYLKVDMSGDIDCRR